MIDIKTVIGVFVMIGIVLIYIPYYLFVAAHKTLFLTYFANVDIVANILSINFPQYFDKIYNIDPTGISQYITYNAISLIALSGIFLHGISYKNKGEYSDISILLIMVLMSIITWTLPTQLIPYLERKTKEYFDIKDRSADIFITTMISGIFILLEGILIHYLVVHNVLLSDNHLNKIKIMF